MCIILCIFDIVHVFKGLTFSEDMSDRDFKAYLESEGVRERDLTSLIGRYIISFCHEVFVGTCL